MNEHNFTETNLGELCEFINGGPWKANEYTPNGIPVTRVTNFVSGSIDLTDCKFLANSSFEKYQKHQLFENDLLVATVGSHPKNPSSAVGRTVRVPPHADGSLLNQNAVCIRPINKEILDNDFLYYFAQTDEFQDFIFANSRGSANQVRMSIGRLKMMPIMLPSLEIQKNVANLLNNQNDLIDSYSTRNKSLINIAQYLFDHWFIDFQFKDNPQMIESEFGLIPKGWEIKKMEDYVNFERGIEPGSRNYQTNPDRGNIPFYRVGDLSKRTNMVYVHKELCKGKEVSEEDILISLDGTLGLVKTGVNGSYSSGLRKCQIIDASMNKEFLYFTLKSDNIQSTILSHSRGTTIQHAGSSTKHMQFILPPKDLLILFEKIVNPIFGYLSINSKRINKLKEIQKLALPKLITGQINASNIVVEVAG